MEIPVIISGLGLEPSGFGRTVLGVGAHFRVFLEGIQKVSHFASCFQASLDFDHGHSFCMGIAFAKDQVKASCTRVLGRAFP